MITSSIIFASFRSCCLPNNDEAFAVKLYDDSTKALRLAALGKSLQRNREVIPRALSLSDKVKSAIPNVCMIRQSLSWIGTGHE